MKVALAVEGLKYCFDMKIFTYVSDREYDPGANGLNVFHKVFSFH